ncbi:expressed unknown protein [Seminavis robusta]|uniref:Uncharacterized protein n=1 Tax=Seminavis robusta TaxID=568900 RepID=A0A9N8E166_9STRA|nr:expressed unknown protein [Seminavis robusta]|eukprot:Sro516_g158431.1  (114) ;mRNA; f:9427-9768
MFSRSFSRSFGQGRGGYRCHSSPERIIFLFGFAFQITEFFERSVGVLNPCLFPRVNERLKCSFWQTFVAFLGVCGTIASIIGNIGSIHDQSWAGGERERDELLVREGGLEVVL